MNILFTAHAVVDGNKRTGFVTFLLFLAINLCPSHLDLENYPDHVSFFKKMASRNTKDEHNVPEIMAWFKKNVA